MGLPSSPSWTSLLSPMLFKLVMCRAQLQAMGWAKPSPFRPGWAGPWWWPDRALGLAWDVWKPKAMGSGHVFSSKFLEEQGHHLENGKFNLNHILEIFPFSNIFTHLRRKLIRKTTAASKYPRAVNFALPRLIKWLALAHHNPHPNPPFRTNQIAGQVLDDGTSCQFWL